MSTRDQLLVLLTSPLWAIPAIAFLLSVAVKELIVLVVTWKAEHRADCAQDR